MGSQIKDDKLGIFGGAFDPVHNGHVLCVRELIASHGFDQIVIVPSYLSPHKEPHEHASYADRSAMVRLAFAQVDHVVCSDVQEGMTYSIDIIRELRSQYGDADLHYIVGVDAFLGFASWKDALRLFDEMSWLVVTRSDYELRPLEEFLPKELMENLSPCGDDGEAYQHTSGHMLNFAEVSLSGISSTDIRDQLIRGGEISDLVPSKVKEYIEEHHLYGVCGDPSQQNLKGAK